MNIDDLFIRYGTNKGGPLGWGYSPYYQQALEARREDVRNVLEIGICGFLDFPNNVVGASLFAWRDFFPNARIHGVDNDARFVFNDKPRIVTRLTNAYDLVDMAAALAEFDRTFDFVCDDAVHDPSAQMQLCAQIWPWVVPGGVYAIEEICPYKYPNGDPAPFYRQLEALCPGMTARECVTHKPERLLLCTKAV